MGTVSANSFSKHTPVNGPVPGFSQIGGSVGQGGLNNAADTRVVQVALNAVVSSLAGPNPPLVVDGIIGPLTIKAIRNFQAAWTRVKDGRVDPGGPTIRVLNRLAGAAPPLTATSAFPGGQPGFSLPPGAPPSPPPAPRAPTTEELKAIGRLQFVQTGIMPFVVLTIVAAVNLLVRAQLYIGSLQTSRPPTGDALRSEDRLSFLFAAKHFRLHEADPFGSLLAIQQLTAVFARMVDVIRTRTLSTPLGPRFDRLYSLATIPPQIAGRSDIAYAGTASGALRPGQPDGFTVPDPVTQKDMPELCDGIYLLPGFDSKPNLSVSVLLHELAHLCGGFSPQSQIIDFTFKTAAEFDAQPRAQRLQDVSCYEMFSTELLVGTAPAAAGIYGFGGFTLRLPSTVAVARLVAPPAVPGVPDPIAFPAGFA